MTVVFVSAQNHSYISLIINPRTVQLFLRTSTMGGG